MFAGIELIPSGATDVVAEFDFIVVRDGSILGGECKANATLHAKDINTARLAADLGLSRFSFCTLRDAFDADSTKLIEDLRGELKDKERAMAVRVLTSRELLNVKGEPETPEK